MTYDELIGIILKFDDEPKKDQKTEKKQEKLLVSFFVFFCKFISKVAIRYQNYTIE
ncbi:hypothetical protein [Clostridium sp. OS1-26]|uniref:hypothetical protein n=1 Tax=Clostridium sp. OS1-26 TaxID=3070681 RepID=UPI0027E1A164|nr:hypothetical protein [Clostridium sp. OS1-26]WML33926.1 hypothetical protein RCG18_21775 [Clostridium sp. OS1-26]